jgi:hypothetical protein
MMTAVTFTDLIFNLYQANELLLNSIINTNSSEYQIQDKITQQWFDLWASLKKVEK